MPAKFTASGVFKAVDKMTKPFKQMQRAGKTFVNKTELGFARLERRARKLKNAVGSLGLTIGGALLLGAVVNITSVFANFEQANASLSSVMANATQPQLIALQEDAKRLGATTAKTATEVVGLQESFARLGFGADAVINMTEATIAGSVAMQGPLADTAELVGAMVKSFDNFSSVDAPNIIDQLTRSTQQSALNFEKLQTGLPIVAGAANAAKVPFNSLLALMGKLSDAGIDASSSSTALRNIFLEAAAKGVPYQKLLDQVTNSTDQLNTANKLFGKRGAVAAVILAKQTQNVEKLSKGLLQGAGAQAAAAKQLNTLRGSVTILGSAWEGFILSIEDGNGSISQLLKTIVQVATEVLSMATGTAKARAELTEGELRIRKLAETANFFIKVLKYTVIGLVALKAALIANQVIIAGAKFVQLVTTFMGIAKAQGIWTAAQWALNAAMAANPIGLIIIGIAALITGIVLLITNWKEIVNWVKTSDNWFARLIRFSLKPIVFLFGLIKKGWIAIKTAFASGKIGEGIRKIGKTLLFFLLRPIEALLVAVNKITFGKVGGEALGKIQEFRAGLLEDVTGQSGKEITTTKTAAAQESIRREERITKQTATLNINNNTNNDIAFEGEPSFPIKLTPTN